MKGTLIVSLDFELFWGVQDVTTFEDYGRNVLGVWNAVPKLLRVFQDYNVHATWATVGLMFAQDGLEAQTYFPEEMYRPTYEKKELSSYECFDALALNKENSAYFYGPDLIRKIAETAGQEIGSHTFSHYYCDEAGQTPQQFYYDMQAAKAIAQNKGFELKSFVFPRNQSVDEYVKVLEETGFTSYRSMAENWIHYKVKKGLLRRALRLIDVYLPLTGSNAYLPKKTEGIINLPGSNMYKPKYNPLAIFEALKIYRIKRQMRYAAKHKLVYHLWWHPHNIGVNTEFHLKQLHAIFQYYKKLQTRYGMQSLNMSEATEYYRNKQ